MVCWGDLMVTVPFPHRCVGLSKESNQHTIRSYGGSKRIDQRAEEPA